MRIQLNKAMIHLWVGTAFILVRRTCASSYTFEGPLTVNQPVPEVGEYTILSDPPTDYILKFKIKPTAFPDYDQWDAIFWAIEDETRPKEWDYGQRAPSVHMIGGKIPNQTANHFRLRFHVGMTDSPSYSEDMRVGSALALNEEHSIELRVEGSNRPTVKVNGTQLDTKTVNGPWGERSQLGDVKIYVGDPWHAKNTGSKSILSDVCFSGVADSDQCQLTETSPPTTAFEGQNFTIGRPQSEFNNDNGSFSIELDYKPVGHSIKKIEMSLRYSNCSALVDDPVVQLENVVDDFDTPKLLIDSTKISSSSLVLNEIESKGKSVGVLTFCVRAEGFDGDGADATSVSFRQDEMQLTYDLSSNDFTVTDNVIKADEVKTSESNITTKYNVTAFRCSTDFTDSGTSDVLAQNEILYICVQPVGEAVYISNFEMGFWQDDVKKYEAVSYGGVINTLSRISMNGKTKRVASRVISSFFNGDTKSFNVQGNAYLSFDSTRSRQLRSVQEPDQAREAAFRMEVGLEKKVVPGSNEDSATKEMAALSILGGLITFSIAIFIFKKMKN